MDTVYIRQGDSTDFIDNILLRININTDKDLTDFTGRFQLQSVIIDYDDLTSKSIPIKFTYEQTDSLSQGYCEGAFKVYDTDKRPATILTNIPFEVQKGLVSNG